MQRRTLEDRIAHMKPGETEIYHTGYLQRDRELGENFLQVDNTATGAWAAMEAGKVHLVKKRLGWFNFEYMVVKRKPPFKKIEWMGCYNPEYIVPKKPQQQLQQAA